MRLEGCRQRRGPAFRRKGACVCGLARWPCTIHQHVMVHAACVNAASCVNAGVRRVNAGRCVGARGVRQRSFMRQRRGEARQRRQVRWCTRRASTQLHASTEGGGASTRIGALTHGHMSQRRRARQLRGRVRQRAFVRQRALDSVNPKPRVDAPSGVSTPRTRLPNVGSCS